MADGKVAVGHPIDIASGAVFTVQEDFKLPGTVGLTWRRRYSTDSPVDTWHGQGWTVPYFMKLERVAEGYRLLDENGGFLTFESDESGLAQGQSVHSIGANMELTRDSRYFTILHWHHGTDDVERFCFDAGDEQWMPLLWIENLHGHRVSLQYDDRCRPWRVTQELEARTVELHYDANDLIRSIGFVMEDGTQMRLTSYEYDEARRLCVSTDGAGAQTRYDYDALGRMVRETGPLGAAFVFQYDSSGRCVYSSGTGGYMERRVQYFSAPPMRRVFDSLGHATDYILNAAGQVIQEISPLGAVTTSAYDEHGRLLARTGALGGVTRFMYDAKGNRARIVHPDGSAGTFTHNDLHLMVDYIDPMGGVWHYEYDAAGRASSFTNPLGNRMEWERNALGLITKTRTPGGLEIERRYGPRMRWVEARDAYSLLDRTEFDAFGNQVAQYGAQGLSQSIRFDAKNRPVAAVDALGRERTIKWNALDLPVARTGPDIGWEQRDYDVFGRVIAHRNALGTMTLEYDTEGKVIVVTNRAGERLQRRYDPDGRMVAEKSFDGRVETREYNLEADPVRITKADGRSLALSYDVCGALVRRESSDGAVRDSYEFDSNGELIVASNEHSVVQLERDASGCVIAEVQNGRRLEHVYDKDQHRIARRIVGVQGGTLRFDRDLRGRLLRVHDGAGVCQTLAWDAANRLTERRFPQGIQEKLAYNQQGLLAEQCVVSSDGNMLVDRRYHYDWMDCLVALEDDRRGVSGYAHDAIGRLSRVMEQGQPTEHYLYDANGTVLATHRGDRRTAAGGRTLSDGDREYDYDQAGCIAGIRSGDDEIRLHYDFNGQLTEVVSAAQEPISYIHDALGRRIGKKVGDQHTGFLWDGCVLAGEGRDGELTDTYFFHTLAPLLWWRGSERLAPITGVVGTVPDVFSEDGRRLWAAHFDAYGNLLQQSGSTPCPFRFRGQYFDSETGFHYNFYRTYDPGLGNYLSPDPIGLDGGANFYAYPRSPIDWDDPFGLKCGTDACKAEEKMTKDYDKRGFKLISRDDKSVHANGIDGVYMNKDPNGTPKYIIAECKSGSAVLGWSGKNENIQQLSDKWINSPPGQSGTKRLDAAFMPGETHATDIRNMAGTGEVQKEVYHPDNGVTPCGSYDKPNRGRWTL